MLDVNGNPEVPNMKAVVGKSAFTVVPMPGTAPLIPAPSKGNTVTLVTPNVGVKDPTSPVLAAVNLAAVSLVEQWLDTHVPVAVKNMQTVHLMTYLKSKASELLNRLEAL